MTRTATSIHRPEGQARDDVAGGCAAAFGYAVLAVVLACAAIPLQAYTLCCLWAWFVIPTFHLPGFTMLTAMGIQLLIRMFIWQPSARSSDSDSSPFVLLAAHGILAPAIALGVGWIIYHFS